MHHVARRDVGARQQLGALSTTPTAKPARSYSPGGYMPGSSAVSPPSSAQPARRQPSAMPSITRVACSTSSFAGGEVVEEEQRSRARR